MKKILLINDCKFESIIMKDKLTNIGHKVEVASEYDVLVKITKFDPDIVIANLIMKDTTGDKLIKEVKVKRPHMACILSSCDNIKLESFIESNVDEVISTPINENDLYHVLDKVISKYDDNNYSFKTVEASVGKQVKNLEMKSFSFCPYCGEKIMGENISFAFCPYCGHKF